MPEATYHMTNPALPPTASRPRQLTLSQTIVRVLALTASAAVPSPDGIAAQMQKHSDLPWFRINWEIKALLPIACVLLGGMLLFLLATLSWRDPERHTILFVQVSAPSRYAELYWSCSPTRCNDRWSNFSRRSRKSGAAISASR